MTAAFKVLKSIRLKWIVAAFLSLYSIVILLNIANLYGFFQWDFHSLYYCAKTLKSGLSPTFPNYCTPLCLYFLKIFTGFKFIQAYYLFLLLKCILFLGLVFLWRNGFFERRLDVGFFVLCLFGFDRAVYNDFAAGNFSVLVQLFLWGAFYCYLRSRLFWCSALIILASAFNLQTAFFLVLLLLAEEEGKYAYFFGSIIVFLLMLLLTYLITPGFINNLATNALGTFGEKGIVHPSTFAFIHELGDFLSTGPWGAYSKPITIFLYIALMAAIMALSLAAYFKIKSQESPEKRKWIVFFSCLVFALVAPGFKDYSYIILIPPAYFIMRKMKKVSPGIIFFVFTLLSAALVPPSLPGIYYCVYFLWNYYPLFLAFMIWGVYIHEIK